MTTMAVVSGDVEEDVQCAHGRASDEDGDGLGSWCRCRKGRGHGGPYHDDWPQAVPGYQDGMVGLGIYCGYI